MYSRLRSNPYTSSVLKALPWIPVVVFFVDHGFSYATVEGRSMQPTFNPDTNMLQRDIVLLNKWAATDHEFSRGEIVTLISPTEPKRIITKRIIALQGDTVKPLRSDKLVRVPRGHCWVEGDEAFHSKDSNSFGTVPIALINAKVTRILWPPSRFGAVEKKPLSDRVQIGFIQPGKDEDFWG
ncbi:mitochondrial inner membrane protease subunit 2 [Halteromyces radiatus]|uniref:mitochondrial inner membrane protease subunit 2 n=1 Tax=Halteromyces radiatus TaxID=101107 RepID=UPI00222091B3|nr:mitochondrial inner membrane protease subunit 2 [Halteromyces radiatus]KAI8084947.1 mitochondrial inner membrane protease subunit 2 [Halteromyces radiatus]